MDDHSVGLPLASTIGLDSVVESSVHEEPCTSSQPCNYEPKTALCVRTRTLRILYVSAVDCHYQERSRMCSITFEDRDFDQAIPRPAPRIARAKLNKARQLSWFALSTEERGYNLPAASSSLVYSEHILPFRYMHTLTIRQSIHCMHDTGGAPPPFTKIPTSRQPADFPSSNAASSAGGACLLALHDSACV